MNREFVIIGFAVLLILVSYSGCLNQQEELDVTINPFLWRVEGDPASFLYGTIHVSDERVLTLPGIVIDAMDESDIICTEISYDLDSKSKTTNLYNLDDNETLEDILSEDLLERLYGYIDWAGHSRSAYSRYKIWYIALILPLKNFDNKYDTNYLKDVFLDEYIHNLAILKEKEVAGIETIEEQTTVLNVLTTDEQIEYLTDALDFLEENAQIGGQLLESNINSYLEGDLDSFYEFYYETMHNYDENNELHKKILELSVTNRNYIMADYIEDEIIEHPDTQYFFAIGAAHFYGQNGIINIIKDKGYTITRVPFNESNDCVSPLIKIGKRCYLPYNDVVIQDAYYWYERGNDYLDNEKYIEALDAFNNAIILDPNFALSWYNKGVCHMWLNKYEEALDAFNTAIDLDPENPYSWQFKGWALQELGRNDEATASLEKAYDLDPTLEN